MQGRFVGRTAIVTGATRGIGRATALRLAREGATVVVNHRGHSAAALGVVREIESAGGRAFALSADVRDRAAVFAMVEAATATAGAVDILVSNAGTLVMGSAAALDERALMEAVHVNVAAAAHCIAAVLPGMRTRGYGRIVTVAATSAFGTTAAGIAPHAIAKSGVVTLTKQVALELRASGITVNAVCPGAIDTEVTLPGGALHEALQPVRRRQLEHTLLGRIGAAEDVAAAIAFLASDDAGFVTAQALSVDGGRTDFLSRSG